MKRVYVNEDWCLGCHLCEYYCGCAHSAQQDMVKEDVYKRQTPSKRGEKNPPCISKYQLYLL